MIDRHSLPKCSSHSLSHAWKEKSWELQLHIFQQKTKVIQLETVLYGSHVLYGGVLCSGAPWERAFVLLQITLRRNKIQGEICTGLVCLQASGDSRLTRVGSISWIRRTREPRIRQKTLNPPLLVLWVQMTPGIESRLLINSQHSLRHSIWPKGRLDRTIWVDLAACSWCCWQLFGIRFVGKWNNVVITGAGGLSL